VLPKHGKVECRACFERLDSKVRKPNDKWRMVNDPGAWGGGTTPEYLVLGFSKGATQTGVYDSGRFEDVAFAGMRDRLTQALRAIGVLSQLETCDDKISNPNSNIAFGSLIRCSVSRHDEAASRKKGMEIYGCTGPLITKSFKEIPEIISTCTSRFLTDLPLSIRAVFFLGNSDVYVKGCQSVLQHLFASDYRVINPMAVRANGRVWVHLAHPSGLNGHFNTWLTTNKGPGLKRLQACAALFETGRPIQRMAYRRH